MWLFALCSFFVFFVLQTLLKRRLALDSNIPPSIPMLLSYVLGILPLGVIIGLMLPHHVQWSSWVVILLLIEGVFIGLFSWLSFRAFKLIPTAHFQTIFQVSTLTTIALGWLLLNERLTVLQIVGAIGICAAAFMAIWSPVRAHRKGLNNNPHFKKGVILTLLSAVTMSIGLVAEKAALNYMDFGAYIIFGFAAQTLGSAIIALPSLIQHPLQKVPKKIIQQSALYGLLSNGVGFSYLYALTATNNISLITALRAFGLPLTAVAAHFVLKERDNSRLLWAGITLGVISVIITAL